MSAEQVAGWTALGARFLTVRPTFSTHDGPDAVIDATGSLRAWMTRFGARVVVVRPDRFVAATDATGLDVPPSRGNLARPARPWQAAAAATDRTTPATAPAIRLT